MSKKNSYRWLMSQSAIARSWLLLSIFLGTFSGALIISQAAILATIIDHVYLHHQTLQQLSLLVWLILTIAGLRALITWAREYTGFKTASRIKMHIRQSLYQHLQSLRPDDINKQKTGALVTTLIEKVDALHDFFSDYLPQLCIVILLPCLILFLVFRQNWMAGCILLITAPLVPLFMALIGMGVEALNQRHFQSLSRLSAHFLDILQGLSTLTLFNRAQAQIQSIHDVSESYREKTMHVLRVAFLSSAVLELFSTVAIALIAVYLGLGLLGLIHVGFSHQLISLQSAFFILLLAPEFFMPLRQLGVFYHARAQAIAASSELLKAMGAETPATATATATATANNRSYHGFTNYLQNIQQIYLQQIDFAYPNKPLLFKHFNLTISWGECVVILGPSGAGKSTLLKLIAKLQTSQEGKITVNETDLAQIDSDDWRSNIAWLDQDPYLFHDTIAANIALGKPNASPQDIQTAAMEAQVFSFTRSLPKGLNTLIGEQHLGLSGGQAQRVALARAIIKDAPIVLLDEPTAHLDEENRQAIFRAIERWKSHKIVVIATHDPVFITMADKVVKIEAGLLSRTSRH